MKMKLIGLAVAGAMAALSGVAQADYLPSQSDYTIHLSGATASAEFVKNGLIDRICLTPGAGATDNITYYQVDSDDWTVVCQVNPAAVPSVTAGDVVMFVKQGGGSGDGTSPVLAPASNYINYQKAPLNAAPTCGAPVAAATGVGTAFSSYTGCTFATVSLPGGDFGLSDVEPQMFFDVNTPSTGNVFNDVNNEMSVQALAGLQFGVVATKSLARAFQALQFPTGNICHPATRVNAISDTDGDGIFGSAGDTVHNNQLVGNILLPAQVGADVYDVARVGAGTFNAAADASPSLGNASILDTEGCMPSLTKPEIVGLFTGGITRWEAFHNEAGETILQTAAAANAAAGTTVVGIPTSSASQALNNQRVHLCRRNAGSGTNAQFQAIFLNRPCAKIGSTFQSQAMLETSPSTCSFTGTSVICMNTGSSDLDRCMHALENNALSGNSPELFNNADTNPTNNTRFAWGVGYQSVEKNVNLARGYRFVKVHEVSPTLANSWRGDYFDVAESTCQWNSSAPSVSSLIAADPVLSANPAYDETGRTVPAGFKADLGSTLCASGAVDTFISNLNFIHAFGTTGWLVVPDADGFPGSDANAVIEAPLDPAVLMDPNGPKPVSTWTRGGKTCQPGKVVDKVSGTISQN